MQRVSRLPAVFLDSLLLLAVFWSRLHNLTAMPLYWDESFHIQHMRHVMNGVYFTTFSFARWLHVFVTGLLRPGGIESPWLARGVVVIVTMLTATAVVWLARWVARCAGSEPVAAGRWALGVYALMPFVFFYNRQTMADPFMDTFAMLAVIASVVLAQRRQWSMALVTGVLLALAVLSKFSGALFLPVPFAAALLLPATWRARWRAGWLAVVSVVVFGAIFGGAYWLALNEGWLAGGGFGLDFYRWCHTADCGYAGNPEPTGDSALLRNLALYAEAIPTFYTWPYWLLALAALPLSWLRGIKRSWLPLLFLLVPAFGLVVPYVPLTELFPPRYFTYTTPAVAVLAGVSISIVVLPWLRERGLPGWVGRLFGAAALANGAVLTAWMLFSPLTVPMTPFERGQYEQHWPSGAAVNEMVDDLYADHVTSGKRINLLVTGESWMALSAQWGTRHGVSLVFDDSEAQMREIVPWLLSGDLLYLVDDTPLNELPPDPYGLVLAPVATYDFEGSAQFPGLFSAEGTTARVWQVTSAHGELADLLNRTVYGDPTAYAADYETLRGDVLLRDGADVPLLLFPALQQYALNSDGLTVVPLAPDWPLDGDMVAGALAEAVAGHDRVHVVLWEPWRGDPQKHVERWLFGNLYPESETWYGPLRLIAFSNFAALGQTAAVGETLGGQFTLSQVALNPTVMAGDAVPVAVTWQADSAGNLDYTVFVHVLDAEGNLVAQHDGIPMAGLAPTSGWQAGEVVVDRFKLAFSPDVVPGDYRVFIGLYDPASGARLMSGSGADVVDTGVTVTVQGDD